MKPTTKTVLPIFVFFTLAAMSAPAALADSVLVTFDHPAQSGPPGTTLQFFGTITNLSAADTVFLNNDDLNPGGSAGDFTVNDLFLANVPVSLAPAGSAGDSSGDIELFDITISSLFTDSFTTYNGLYTLQGGIDGNAQDILTSPAITFSVNVTTPGPATPEPATCLLVACGLFALSGWRFAQRKGNAEPLLETVPRRVHHES